MLRFNGFSKGQRKGKPFKRFYGFLTRGVVTGLKPGLNQTESDF
jgi:hypothetical protein